MTEVHTASEGKEGTAQAPPAKPPDRPSVLGHSALACFFNIARLTGLEPATTGSTVRYSNQLSYSPNMKHTNAYRTNMKRTNTKRPNTKRPRRVNCSPPRRPETIAGFPNFDKHRSSFFSDRSGGAQVHRNECRHHLPRVHRTDSNRLTPTNVLAGIISPEIPKSGLINGSVAPLTYPNQSPRPKV